MILNCREVNIRFKSQSLHQQRIRYTDHTGATLLGLAVDKEFITVSYLYEGKEGLRPLKVLIYNTNEVVEVEAEDNVKVLD